MPNSIAPFVSIHLSIFIASFFIVMTTAFLSFPHAIAGHPGEQLASVLTNAEYHLT